MVTDYSYRFKPEMKKFNLGSFLNIAVLAILAYFAYKLFSGKGPVGGLIGDILGTNGPVLTEAAAVQKAINKAQLPKVDDIKMLDRMNQLENKLVAAGWLRQLFPTDSSGVYDLLSDLNKDELDWVFLYWGTRSYNAGIVGRDPEDLDLFGWFNAEISMKYETKLKVLFELSTFKYRPA